MNNKIKLELPLNVWIELSINSNYELADIFKIMIRNQLFELGYQEDYNRKQKQRLDDIRKNLSSIIGKDGMDKIDSALDDAKTALVFATNLNKQKVN